MNEEIRPCRHYGLVSGHFHFRVCDGCYRERYFAAEELIKIRDRKIVELERMVRDQAGEKK